MKKNLLIFIILLLANNSIFSKDNDELINCLREKCTNWYEYETYDTMKFYSSINIYDNNYLVLGIKPNIDTIYFYLTDGTQFANRIVECAIIDNSKAKYKYKNTSLYIADFDYDGKNDFISYCHGEPNDTYIDVFSVFKNKSLLEIDFTDYAYREYQFSWIDYCIVNGKRGIRVRSRGESRLIDDYYFFDGKKDHFSFFYWSASEQRYILDETVTQAQIKNAYCPEEYFAYNGLDFSKLDKALKKSDIKDLTPAQLRLMRNAIYARHGRKFTSVDLQSLWECYTWYKPNPDYTDSMLTKTDKMNIKLIQEMEKVKGAYVPDLPK